MNIRSPYLHLIFLILCGWQLPLSDVFAEDKVVAVNSSAPIPLSSYFSVLEDPSRGLALAEILKPEVASRFHAGQPSVAGLNFSYSSSAFWLRLTVRNERDTPLEQVLEVSKARLSSVQFYWPTSDGSYQSVITGDLPPFSTRPYKNRFFVFPITLPPHAEQVLYLRIQSDSAVFIPARLWSAHAFHAYERNDYLTQALYFGMALAMILFNLLLFIALRDVIYLRYVVFVMLLASAIATQNGLIKEFFWFDSLLFSSLSAGVAFSLAQVGFMMFMRHMLKIRETMPRIDRWLKVFIGLQLILPIGYAISVPAFAMPGQILHLATMVIIMSIGLYCAFKRQRSAYFFVAAFGILFVSGVVTSLAGLGLLPANAVSMNALQFGSAMEMLLLAFALADRFIVIRREKEKAQQQLVETLQSSERILEERVEQRTTELQTLNKDLEKAESDQRILLSIASHEFRTPAAMIKASLDSLILLKDRIQPEVAQRLENIGQASLRLNRLANSLISFDRLQELALKPKKQILDIGQLASEVTSKYLGNDTPQLQLPKHPISLQGDSILLSIALHNLIDNALRYHKGINFPIIVSIEESPNPEDHWVELRVADRGPGIPDADKELIFQRFYSTQGTQSNGLGLSIVLSIAQAHGGTAFALDNTPRGAVLVIRLLGT